MGSWFERYVNLALFPKQDLANVFKAISTVKFSFIRNMKGCREHALNRWPPDLPIKCSPLGVWGPWGPPGGPLWPLGRSNARRYVTSNLSEPRSLNQFQVFTSAQFLWKWRITCPGKPNFTPAKLVHDSHFMLNTSQHQKLTLQSALQLKLILRLLSVFSFVKLRRQLRTRHMFDRCELWARLFKAR